MTDWIKAQGKAATVAQWAVTMTKVRGLAQAFSGQRVRNEKKSIRRPDHPPAPSLARRGAQRIPLLSEEGSRVTEPALEAPAGLCYSSFQESAPTGIFRGGGGGTSDDLTAYD
jgi:hypothetical protein